MKEKFGRKNKSRLIAVFIFLVIGCLFAGIYGLVSAETSNAGRTITPPVKDGVSELGTAANPLFILEIVPNKSFSEIGYLIPGCEPVDMEKLAIDGLAYTYQSRKLSDCTFSTEQKYDFEIDKAELDSGSGNWDKKNSKNVSGYFQKVTDGTGTIKQVKNGSIYTYTYVGTGLGQYIWVPSNNINNIPKDDTADKVWTTVIQYSRTKMVYTHKNTFLKEAIKVPADRLSDYHSVVITVDPSDLANSANLELINKADIIYINGKSHDPGLVSIWNKFNKDGLTLANPPANFQGSNDLTWDAVMAIFKRMVSKNRAALIMDLTSVYLGGDSDNNAHKLCIMLLQIGPANFNRLFVSTNKIKTTTFNGRVTGYYVGKSGNESILWGQKTFPDNGEGTKYGDLVFKNPHITSSNITAGEGVYTYNGDMSLLENLEQQNIYETDSTRTVVKDAFDFYEYYDRYEKAGANPNAPRRTSLSPVDAIYFILHQKFDWADKTVLNILEIEPYDSFIYGSTGWEARYRKFFPYFMGTASDIHVTTMTTYDYIGKIEDINAKYDMVLIGLNTAYKDITKYNDDNLKGKIYLSIGDRVTTDNSVRYSGNDLTNRKLTQLKNFMLSGRPVVLASGFYTDTTRAKVAPTVDKATYMYDLADVIKQSNVTVNTEPEQADYRARFIDKIFYEDNFNSYILERKISDSSCSLEFADKSDNNMYPVTYSYTTNSDGSISSVKYNGSSTLKYRFRIKGTADAYAVKLFIDNNGDGQYNGSLDTPTSAKPEVISGLTVKDDTNTSINVNSLKPNTWYTLTRHLDATYQGIIPWKLEVNSIANPSIRTSEINYTVIKQISEASKVQINVLQVVIDAGTGSPGSNFNMQRNETFQKFLSSVPEYKVSITYMDNATFLSKYSKYNGQTVVSGKYDVLDNYDMLILGFRDTCSYTNNKYANQDILDFINQGKSVIFSHDVIWDKDAGQERLYNDVLRKKMSQDRYHFTTGVSDNQQPIYYNDTSNQLIMNGIKMYDSANLTSGNDKYWKFFTDNSNKLYWRYGSGYNYDRKDDTSNKKWNELSFMETTRVSVANRGQITQYPFTIGDSIRISTTHTQYYQLDLEQSDMVVWYNLSDNSSRLNGGSNNGFYSSRENDSRNSYYIYNKGNITYTGLGHTVNLTDDEMKLFINTMISSYRAGTAKAKIIITNQDVYTGDSNQQYLFINADSDTITTTDPTQVKTITFKLEDESVVSTSDRDYYASYYAVVPDPADSSKTIRVQLNPQGSSTSTEVLPTKNIDTGGTCTIVSGKGTKLNSDNEFSIDVPIKYFNGAGKLLIEMELTSVGINEDGNTIEQKSTTQVNLITKPFFDLD